MNLRRTISAGGFAALAFLAAPALASNISSGGGGSGGTPGGASGQLQYNNAGVFGGFTLSGDCTLAQPAITCTKTNGAAFAPSATTDTTNAANISSGTLPNARLASVPNSALANASVTYGTTTVSLGGSSASIAGLLSVGLAGSTSGTLTIACPAACGASALTLPAGTTNFSATGGASQVVEQTSAGGALSVARLACADLSNSTGACSTPIGTSGAAIPLLNAGNTWSGIQSHNAGDLVVNGATSGALTINCAAVCGANTITLPAGTTDFSSTGGASQVVRQTSAGGAFTVARLACADLSNAGTGCSGTLPASANPSATIGLSAVNGTASTFMTSDSAPALSQAIAPTWTGAHTWSLGSITTNTKAISVTGTFNASGTTFDAPIFENITNTASATGSLIADLQVGGTSLLKQDAIGTLTVGAVSGNPAQVNINAPTGQNPSVNFTAGGTSRGQINSSSNNINIDATNGGTVTIGTNTGALAETWDTSQNAQAAGNLLILNGTAVPAGGVAGKGYMFSSTANLGIFFGSGAPTLNAAQGSVYIRTDGSSTSTRLYVNTNGTTGWTNFTSAS